MAARPTWKGYLKISLVNIPVRVFPATDAAATISFNQLHRECRTRIQQKRWCPTCQTEVANTDLVKGYEFEKGKYVVLDEEDIAKVRSESTRVINVVQFTDAKVIDPVYVERPYYLAPDGAVAAEAFAVMREGMAGKAAVGKVALYGREYLVAIQPRENGLVMYTLRHASEVRAMGAIDELKTVPVEDQARRGEARAAGHRQLRDRRRPDAVQGRVSGRAAARSSTPRSPARKSSRPRRRRRRRSSTSWRRCARAWSASHRPRSGRPGSATPRTVKPVGPAGGEKARPRMTAPLGPY